MGEVIVGDGEGTEEEKEPHLRSPQPWLRMVTWKSMGRCSMGSVE